jgi:thioester reductase-like protein
MPGVTPFSNLNLQAEAVLDPTIQFQNPLSENSANPKRIFLTGATGLVGAYLLDELLHQTTADIYCLIRAGEPDSAKQRLKSHLQNYSLWQETFSPRIIPIMGDLSKPLFGLLEQKFNGLAGQLDVIYHSGGWVNNIRPYSVLKATNVLGTQEVLRLASLTQTKPVHFISSMAVFFSEAHTHVDLLRETDVPKYDSSLKGGYKQSKWVADKLVMTAQKRGLPACIYRPVRITGHSKTGITSDFKDLLNLMLKSCICLGKFPALEIEIPLVPVDYVSQAVVHLSLQEKSLGRAFHLFSPQPIPWKNLFDIIRSFGYSLEKIPYDQWRDELRHHASRYPEKKFYSLLRLLLSAPNNLFFERPPFDACHTLEGLAGTSIICPSVDVELISTYFSYFQKSGYIPIPSKRIEEA